tara:strand:- start:1114 stop:1227 length:114 start_codon:yes stop_codon:yes gene_type:complete
MNLLIVGNNVYDDINKEKLYNAPPIGGCIKLVVWREI